MRKYVIWAVIVVAALIFTLQFINPAKKEGEKISSPSIFKSVSIGNKIAMINIYGTIEDPRETLSQIKYFTDMKKVKAIVLSIDSPGGSVGASQEIYRQLKKSRESGKIIVAAMGGTAASGAYYIAAAADLIVANPGTVTGSIGVIMSFFSAEKLLDKAGVKFTTIKTGEFKDTGSFSRPSTERERAYLKGVADDVLDQFVQDVADNRFGVIAAAHKFINKDEEKLKKMTVKLIREKIADGRIFTGRQALELGLVDKLGNIDDAIEEAALMAGIDGRPSVLTAKKRQGFTDWLDSRLNVLAMGDDRGFSLQYILK